MRRLRESWLAIGGAALLVAFSLTAALGADIASSALGGSDEPPDIAPIARTHDLDALLPDDDDNDDEDGDDESQDESEAAAAEEPAPVEVPAPVPQANQEDQSAAGDVDDESVDDESADDADDESQEADDVDDESQDEESSGSGG